MCTEAVLATQHGETRRHVFRTTPTARLAFPSNADLLYTRHYCRRGFAAIGWLIGHARSLPPSCAQCESCHMLLRHGSQTGSAWRGFAVLLACWLQSFNSQSGAGSFASRPGLPGSGSCAAWLSASASGEAGAGGRDRASVPWGAVHRPQPTVALRGKAYTIEHAHHATNRPCRHFFYLSSGRFLLVASKPLFESFV